MLTWLAQNSDKVATLVGLLVTYRSLASERAAQTKEDFIDWLYRSNHKELVTLIQRHAELSEGIDQLLLANSQSQNDKLDQIQQTLENISKLILTQPLPEIHPQAFHGMVCMVRSRVKWFTLFGGDQIMIGEDFDPFTFESDDFKGDLEALEAHGYVRLSWTGNGDPRYDFTRRAFDYVKALPVT